MTKDLDTEKLLPFIPLKRFGTAEEVAGEKSFLLIIFCRVVCGLMGATTGENPLTPPTHTRVSFIYFVHADGIIRFSIQYSIIMCFNDLMKVMLLITSFSFTLI